MKPWARLHATTISRWLVCLLTIVVAKLSYDEYLPDKEYLHLVIVAASGWHPRFGSELVFCC